MKFLPLIWAGLWRKRARTIFTLLSIVVAFLLVGIMSGLNASFTQIMEQSRFDRIMVNSRFGRTLPIAYVDQIARMNGVTHIDVRNGVYGYYGDRKNGFGIQMGDAHYLDVWPELPISPGQFEQLQRVRNGVILSRQLAERFHWKVGDTIPLQSQLQKSDGSSVWTFSVVAVVPDIEKYINGFALGNYVYSDTARASDKGTVDGIDLLIKDPARAMEITRAVEKLFANSDNPVRATPEQLASQNGLQGIVNINYFTHAVTAITLSIILLLTGNVIAQSVRERIPEFAAMKAMGFSDRGIFALVLAEAILPCVIGACLGLILAEGSTPIAHKILATGFGFPVPQITLSVIAYSLALAVLLAIAGGLPAALRMKRLSVSQALAGR